LMCVSSCPPFTLRRAKLPDENSKFTLGKISIQTTVFLGKLNSRCGSRRPLYGPPSHGFNSLRC
jgi:hypothetical protein